MTHARQYPREEGTPGLKQDDTLLWGKLVYIQKGNGMLIQEHNEDTTISRTLGSWARGDLCPRVFGGKKTRREKVCAPIRS